MTAPAIGQIDGGIRNSDGNTVPVDLETKVRQDATYAEFLERYANRATRAIILYYPSDEYGKMVEDLKLVGQQLGVTDNAETVKLLIKEKLNNG
jgi:hypothetical protein